MQRVEAFKYHSDNLCCRLKPSHNFKSSDNGIVLLNMSAQVSPSGWSEGECRGKAGWFPSAYVEKRQRIPTSSATTEVF